MWRVVLAFLCEFAVTAAQYENPAWSPDGKRIVFVMKTAESDCNIYSVSVDGSDVRQLTHGSACDPAAAEGKRRISTMSAEGLNVRPVTSGPAEDFHPAFSPDGKPIALTSVENAASRIAAMDSSGMNSQPVTPIEQRIAYFVQGSVSKIWRMDANTLERAKLFDSGLSATTPDWPVSCMVFTRGAGKETGIDILNLETHQLRRVLRAHPAPAQPRWSPDGKQILFAANAGIATLDLTSSRVRAVLH
jgi:Tol biopolymer transport system component